MADLPRVVIVGGGFGGLSAARALRKAPAEITVVDRDNHHLFQPLLYQVATAALSPADIASPIRRILRSQKNTEVMLGAVSGVDLNARRVRLADDVSIPYDYLVLATGARHSYFGHDEWAPHAPGLKTVEDALEIRRRILMAFEEAEWEGDDEARRAKLTFAIVGGGPTGVELAGAIMEIAARSIPRDFRNIDTTTTRVILIQGADRLLPAMKDKSGARARRDLERMGVEIRLGGYVTDVDKGGVWIGEERIEAENVFWAAGVRPSSLAAKLRDEHQVELSKSGSVLVEPDLSIPGHPEAFVVGDVAHVVDPKTGQPVPGVAQGALQEGRHAARLILDQLKGRAEPGSPREAFRYHDKGSMATIGRAKAVADVGTRCFGGFVAWVLWCFVHILFLVGFRNRVMVLMSWAWEWLVFAKGARLITGESTPEVERFRGSDEQSATEPVRL